VRLKASKASLICHVYTRENVGNNEVCIIGILEYHVVLNRAQIKSIKDVSHRAHVISLNKTYSKRQNSHLLPLALVWC